MGLGERAFGAGVEVEHALQRRQLIGLSARAPGSSGIAAAACILPCGLKSGCGGTAAESGDSRLFECAPGSRGCMPDCMPGCMPEGMPEGMPGVGIPNGMFPCVGVDGPKPGEVRGAVALWGKRNDEPPALGT